MAEKNTNKDTAKTKKEGLGKKIKRFFRENKSEIKKISWPTFSEVVKNSLITLIVVLIVGVFIWLVDWGLNAGRDAIFGLVSASDMNTVDISGSDVVSTSLKLTDKEQEIIDREFKKVEAKCEDIFASNTDQYKLYNGQNITVYYHNDTMIASGIDEATVNFQLKQYIANNFAAELAESNTDVSPADAQ